MIAGLNNVTDWLWHILSLAWLQSDDRIFNFLNYVSVWWNVIDFARCQESIIANQTQSIWRDDDGPGERKTVAWLHRVTQLSQQVWTIMLDWVSLTSFARLIKIYRITRKTFSAVRLQTRCKKCKLWMPHTKRHFPSEIRTIHRVFVRIRAAASGDVKRSSAYSASA